MAEKARIHAKTRESEQKCSNSCKKNSGFNSSGSPADRILQLQRTTGNQAVQRLIKSKALQAKLRVGQPNDIYEQEADRVAEQVMRMPDPILQRRCAKCDDNKKKALQVKESLGQVPVNRDQDVPPIIQDVLRSPGQPLDPATRAFIEPRFGHDFSQVRVHTDPKAAESARAVNALAYNFDRDVVFGAGQYTPQTPDGIKLITHELTHVLQQAGSSGINHAQRSVIQCKKDKPKDKIKVEENKGPTQELAKQKSQPASAPAPTPICPTPFKKASTFQQLIELVRAAEARFKSSGIVTPKDQIHALRGIYYGTTWSLDYLVEKSTTRNEGFQRFTRPSDDPAKSVPPDVQKTLDCGLFKALQESQDINDPSGRQVDFGHLIIALDARNDPAFAKNIEYPVKALLMSINIDLGGTGTELVTWLGDLGGGAASLAVKRVTAPGTSASTVFAGSDYGGSINLEGDVAGSIVGTTSPSAVTAPSFAPGKGLSDALQDYLSPAAPSVEWNKRATTFLTMNGGAFDASGALTNRAALINAFSAKIQEFACNYLASRAKDKKITVSDAKAAAESHIVPSSKEVATAFVDALIDSHKSGGKIEATRFPTPMTAGKSACTTQLLAIRILGP